MTPTRITILLVGSVNIAAGAVLALGQAVGLAPDPRVLAAAFIVQAVATYVLTQLDAWSAPDQPYPHG